MEQIDYAPVLPEKPLTDIVSFARQSGRFQEQYLVYKAEREYEPLEERMKAFGWEVTRINGHDLDALEQAGRMPHPGKPLMILCDTNPAQGIPLLEPMVPKHFVRIPAGRRAEFEAFCAQM